MVWKRLLYVLLVGFGLLVGLISLYYSSLSGVMGKLGLLSGDPSTLIDRNELARGMRGIGGTLSCDYWGAVSLAPHYLLTPPAERIQLGAILGYKRMECGVVYGLAGNVERSVYTFLKGLYYLRSSYLAYFELVARDPTICAAYRFPAITPMLATYIASTRGNARSAVEPVVSHIIELQQKVQERCIDQNEPTF
jgi:hypothetical protein